MEFRKRLRWRRLFPRYGLWAAVEREALDGTHPFSASQDVDIHVALRSYTASAAPQLFLEKQIGTLEAGKRADIAVLGPQPLQHSFSRLEEAEVRDDHRGWEDRLLLA